MTGAFTLNHSQYTLDMLVPGQCGTVLTMDGRIARRLNDLGLLPGTRVRCVLKSPLGDPTAYRIRDAVIAIRAADSRQITMGDVL
ncbi:MAG: ferrous iron transport protein A [Oscillospiraceae bacterium]|nr:ferrous iron transport protein A [Oscillospiraceae bacterium]